MEPVNGVILEQNNLQGNGSKHAANKITERRAKLENLNCEHEALVKNLCIIFLDMKEIEKAEALKALQELVYLTLESHETFCLGCLEILTSQKHYLPLLEHCKRGSDQNDELKALVGIGNLLETGEQYIKFFIDEDVKNEILKILLKAEENCDKVPEEIDFTKLCLWVYGNLAKGDDYSIEYGDEIALLIRIIMNNDELDILGDCFECICNTINRKANSFQQNEKVVAILLRSGILEVISKGIDSGSEHIILKSMQILLFLVKEENELTNRLVLKIKGSFFKKIKNVRQTRQLSVIRYCCLEIVHSIVANSQGSEVFETFGSTMIELGIQDKELKVKTIIAKILDLLAQETRISSSNKDGESFCSVLKVFLNFENGAELPDISLRIISRVLNEAGNEKFAQVLDQSDTFHSIENLQYHERDHIYQQANNCMMMMMEILRNEQKQETMVFESCE